MALIEAFVSQGSWRSFLGVFGGLAELVGCCCACRAGLCWVCREAPAAEGLAAPVRVLVRQDTGPAATRAARGRHSPERVLRDHQVGEL